MKQNWWKFQRWTRPALAGLGLFAAANVALAAVPDRVLSTLDADSTGWSKAWGAAGCTWDGTQDATGNGGGSLYINGDCTADQSVLTIAYCIEGNPWWHSVGATNFNMSDYKSVEFDIKWDSANSTLSVADFNSPPKGGEGGIVIWSVNNPFSSQPTLGTIQVPAAAATGWAHVSLPINKAIAGIDPSYGICLKKWVAADQKTAGGTFAFWVDNVKLLGDVPPANPTLSLEKPVPGLALIAASGGTYDRQNIVTATNNYSWLGASGPVTYSFTVAKHADTDHPGFQVHMYFIPGVTNGITDSGPDYGQTNAFVWNIGNNADGSAWSSLRYKTNAPGDNGHLYDTGTLGGPGSSTVVGTWTLTLDPNSNITATSPSGNTFTTNLPPEVVPYFQGSMLVYFGGVPGSQTRIGQMAVLTKAKITGAAGPNIDSDFLTQSVDTNLWRILGNGKYGVQTIPTDSAYWVNWTLPATGFRLESSDKLPASSWNGFLSAGFDAGPKHTALVSKTNLSAGNQSYFRLNKRPFTKLQILLPGETAAPGTLTGKTGTPLAQLYGIPFDIIVNAVDDFWFPITTAPNDSIALTCTDASAQLPANATLSNGTCTFGSTNPLLFVFEGTWTITATDVTDATKKPNTSGPVVLTYQ